MIADSLNTVVRVPSGSEFGAKGAAINAAVATGYFDSYEMTVNHFVRYDREYYPNYENHKKYQKLFEIYIQAYSKMVETWKALSSFGNGMHESE
jgi:sugar (pentulose or hexulose) kinase